MLHSWISSSPIVTLRPPEEHGASEQSVEQVLTGLVEYLERDGRLDAPLIVFTTFGHRRRALLCWSPVP